MESTAYDLTSPEKENTETDNTGQFQENSETQSTSFINNDLASDSSIGSGTADQGIEPGEEEEEDEFRKAISGSSPGPGLMDENFAGGASDRLKTNERSSKGLVEEGPGPDS